MSALLDALSKGPTFAAQLEESINVLKDIRETLVDMLGAYKTPVPRIEDAVVEINLSSDGLTGKTVWNDSRAFRVIRAIVSSDTAGRFAFRIGDSDQGRIFRLAANTPLVLVESKDSPIAIPRGLNFTLVPLSGSPVWELYAWAMPSFSEGTSGARQ